jgi:hypothetical protein
MGSLPVTLDGSEAVRWLGRSALPTPMVEYVSLGRPRSVDAPAGSHVTVCSRPRGATGDPLGGSIGGSLHILSPVHFSGSKMFTFNGQLPGPAWGAGVGARRGERPSTPYGIASNF